jgi:hypothetical protein
MREQLRQWLKTEQTNDWMHHRASKQMREGIGDITREEVKTKFTLTVSNGAGIRCSSIVTDDCFDSPRETPSSRFAPHHYIKVKGNEARNCFSTFTSAMFEPWSLSIRNKETTRFTGTPKWSRWCKGCSEVINIEKEQHQQEGLKRFDRNQQPHALTGWCN